MNHHPRDVLVECCVASFQAAKVAEQGGADRLELNSALELDGLTPSAGCFLNVVSNIRIPVIAMARPRAGDFVYSEAEWEALIADAHWLIENGADGIAFGCLDEKGHVDLRRCRQMRKLVGSRQLVFHKAFDETANWKQAIESLVEVGVQRVMTSGRVPSSFDGRDLISEMVQVAENRIEILPAGGVHSGNAGVLVRETGCEQIHGSFSGGPMGGLEAELKQVFHVLNTNEGVGEGS